MLASKLERMCVAWPALPRMPESCIAIVQSGRTLASRSDGHSRVSNLCLHVCVCVSMFCFEQRETSQAKSVLMDLEGCFGDAFDWTQVQSCGIMYRSLRNNGCSMTCGNILSHAKAQVAAFRNFVGEKLCVFKIGVTANPLMRFPSYIDQGFTFMWVVAESCSKGLIHMLEAALISEFAACSGCRNKLGSGGEGALNRTTAALPPFYVYVAGGRADQNRRVG